MNECTEVAMGNATNKTNEGELAQMALSIMSRFGVRGLPGNRTTVGAVSYADIAEKRLVHLDRIGAKTWGYRELIKALREVVGDVAVEQHELGVWWVFCFR